MKAWRSLLLVWLALMVLLALTWASAFVKLGAWNTVINLAIALVKAGLVLAFFMHLLTARAAERLAGVAALFIVGVLLTLTMVDQRTRVVHVAPWDKPSSAKSEAFGR